MKANFLNADTICALATPHGVSSITVARISGSLSFPIVCSIFTRNGNPFDIDLIVSNKVYYGQIVDNGDMLDEGLVSFFKAPHSFTGEDVVEISLHGSLFIQKRILEILIAHGCRMAEPGEFTRRAFINRKFDLTQAEAIADLISSESESTHHLAINQLKGGFSKELQIMRSKLLEMTAFI